MKTLKTGRVCINGFVYMVRKADVFNQIVNRRYVDVA